MSFDYILSDALKDVFRKIGKKDKSRAIAISRKINQIVALDEIAIEHFKNLQGNLKEYKRVHIGSFVLMFKIQGNQLVFDRFQHHDDAY